MMRKDNDKRSDSEREIDDFLSQFDTGDENATTDVNKYLDPQAKDPMTPSHSSSQHYSRSERNNSEMPYDDDVSPGAIFIQHDTDNDGSRNGKGSKSMRKRHKNRENREKVPFKERMSDLLMIDNPDYDPSKSDPYIKNGKKIRNKPRKLSVKKLIRDIAVVIGVCIVAFFIYAFVVISMAPKIDPENLYDQVAESSTVYDDAGNEVDSIYYTQNRTNVKYSDLSEDTVNAFVALEDKTFWKHHGFNWTRMIGAVFQSLTGSGSISGTSTITQQLARNVYLPNIKSQRSIRRKILEMYYASRIESSLSKKEIVTAYLNTIYLGFGNYGIDSAAHSYFSKEPKDLTLEESAALAALPQAPDSYALVKLADSNSVSENSTNIITRTPDTYVCNDVSKSRRQTCLDLMLQQGYITKKQHDAVYSKDLIDFINPTISSGSSTNSYFKEYMIDKITDDLMKKYKITSSEAERMIYTGGLKIHSTMDSTAQKVVVKEFNNSSNFPYLTNIRKDSSGNIVSSSGSIMLYSYGNMFNSNGDFTLSSSECKVNDDGSVTILKDKRLKIYTTKSNGKTDYSLEFPQAYVQESGTLYIYPGGYINIGTKYKSLDDDDNLVISAKFFKDNPNLIKISGSSVIITKDAYSLQNKVIQPQAAMVIVEVGTGELKAMVGGRQATGSQLYNRAINPRQSGSSIKPLSVYGSALQKSFEYQAKGQKWPLVDYGHDSQGTQGYGDYLTAASKINDEPMTFSGKSWPQNSGGGYSGVVTMRKGLQQSINVVAVKIQMQVGNDYSEEMLKKFGLTTLVTTGTTNDNNTAALALGGFTKGVIPLEMAQAYATFPNGGVRQSTITYTKVEDRKGKTLLTGKSKSTKVLDEGVAFIMTDMLKSVVSNGIGSNASLSGTGVQSGGKTGTTNENYDIWFDGFTPTYAAALWIGTDVNIKLSSMSGAAASLWGKIMKQIPNALKGSYKTMPSDVVYYNGEYFTKGTNSGISSYAAKKKTTTTTTTKKTTTTTTTDDTDNTDNTGGDTAGATAGDRKSVV